MAKYAVLSICYNEEQIIAACINNWKGVVDKHLVLISTEPWNGEPIESDRTYQIAKNLGAEVILGYWPTEGAQRTWGLARLYDYDYVFMVDPDELYTKADQQEMLSRLKNPIDRGWRTDRQLPIFKCNNMLTYWKTYDYVFDPPDKHKPDIILDPKQVLCHEHRQHKYIPGRSSYCEFRPPLNIVCHHMSWVKSNKKVAEKIEQFSHSDIMFNDWYDNVWMKWEPGSKILVRPYGASEQSIAIYKPAPQEIKDLMIDIGQFL